MEEENSENLYGLQGDEDGSEAMEMSEAYDELSDDEAGEDTDNIVQRYVGKNTYNENNQHHQHKDEDDEEEEEGLSEEGDEVNDLSFNQQQQYQDHQESFDEKDDQEEQDENQKGNHSHQEDDEEEDDNYGEEQEEDDGEDEDEDDDQQIGEMKAKFDRIINNYVGENTSKQGHSPVQQESTKAMRDAKIIDFKNKNLVNNVKGIFNKQNSQKAEEQQNDNQYKDYRQNYNDESEDQLQATVQGPNKENQEMSVNIQFNNKKLFPTSENVGKPPIPNKSFSKLSNDENFNINNIQRSSTPDREKPMREKLQRPQTANIKKPDNNLSMGLKPKSGKIVSQQKPVALKRPQTAVIRQSDNFVQEQVKKPYVPSFNQVRRPQTASSGSKIINGKKTGGNKAKKTDPVSRYQNMQSQWQKNIFLKANNNKEGRKLDLDRFHKWSSIVHAHNEINQIKKNQIVKPQTVQKGLIDERKDDLRFQLRAKISQMDYVDKNMKNFHYNKEIVGKTPLQNALGDNGEEANKLELIKKHINHLKKAIE